MTPNWNPTLNRGDLVAAFNQPPKRASSIRPVMKNIGAAVVGGVLLTGCSLAHAAITVTELFDWAERTYPQYFHPAKKNQSLPPYVLRHYPATQNYVGVADGTVYIYGPISANQLTAVGKLADFECTIYPTRCISAGKPATLTVGPGGACAVRNSDSTVQCWGVFPFFSGLKYKYPPTTYTVPGSQGAVSVAMGTNHACMVLGTGRVACWGDNSRMQLGVQDGNGAGPHLVPGIDDATELALGSAFSCALRRTGRVTCWGARYYWQHQAGIAYRQQVAPEEVPGLTDVVKVAGSNTYVCALRRTGQVLCWGAPEVRFLEPKDYLGEKLISIPVSGAVSVSAGILHTCALLQDGTVKCWGEDINYSINGKTYFDQYFVPPTTVVGLSSATQLSLSSNSACAVRSDKSVVCWGENRSHYESLGLPPSGSSLGAVQFAALNGTSELPTGWSDQFSCARRINGAVICWGLNNAGQLGTSTPEFWSEPITVPGF